MNHALFGCLVVFGTIRLASGDAATTPPADVERRFRVSESAPRGEHIGWIDGNGSTSALNDQQNYFIVFPDQTGAAEKLLDVNDRTGEISLRNPLDYEREKELHFIALPEADSAQSAGVKVLVEVVDANDNSPRFPTDQITLNISETARLNTELVLPPAADADSDPNTVKRYRIIAGNVNNMFRVTSHSFNGERYVDLIVNGQLDREFRDRYDLVVEALDGGNPPRKGEITVHVVVLDANDNAPEFSRPRYFASIPRDAPPNFPIVKITASDADVGENGRVTYKIVTDDTHGAEMSHYFTIDEDSGLVTVTSRRFASAALSPYTALTVIVGATDHGQPSPLESTTLLTITIAADNKAAAVVGETLPPALDVVWLTDDGTATVKESAPIGYILARITVEEAKDESRLTLSKSNNPLCLRQTERSTVYLLLVCEALDREKRAVHAYSLVLRRGGDNGDVILDHPLRVTVADVNDNAPIWPSDEWRLQWRRDRFDDVRLTATDLDDGENARIRYRLNGTNMFVIHPETGRLSATDTLDCATEPLRFRVRAEDNGVPRLSNFVDVVVEFVGVGDVQELRFNRSIYEVTVNENATQQSNCILQVTARWSERRRRCGGGDKPRVHYAIGRVGADSSDPFRIDEASGRICLTVPLDFESSRHHQLIVTAASGDGGVKSTTAHVLVHVENADDSAPTFLGASQRLALRADFAGDPLIAGDRAWQRALSVAARDPDDIVNASAIAYSLLYPDEDHSGALDAKSLHEFFRIDTDDGTVFVREPVTITRLGDQAPTHFQLKVLARDVAGHVSQPPAVIDIDLLNTATSDDCGVPFGRRLYEFVVAEDLMPGIAVGHIDLAVAETENYSLTIVDDRDRRFAFDEAAWGKLVLHGELDAETQDVYSLTVEACHKTTACRRNFTQVKITVQDVNDNAPVFLAHNNVSVMLAENFPIHRPFFHVRAVDGDRHENGRIVYELLDSDPPAPIVVGASDGALSLTAPLDRERVARYRLRVRARDGGVPPLFAVTYVDVHVIDVNDNAPQFEQPVYSIDVAEDAPLSRPLATVRAVDADTAAAGTVTYRMAEEDDFFGVDPTSGLLYLRRSLDRERQDVHTFVVVAEDGGTPSLAANASVRVRVLDVNDHAPDCTSVGTMTLPAGRREPSDTPIGWVRATDPDEATNGTIVYRLQLPHPLFDVKSKGDVYLRKRLPTRPDVYTLSVVVEDGGKPPLVSVCRLRVRMFGTEPRIDDGDPPVVTVTTATTLPQFTTIATASDAATPLLRLTGDLTSGARLMNVASKDVVTPIDGRYFQLAGDKNTGLRPDEIFELDELNGDLYLRDTWALRNKLRARPADELELRVVTLASDASAGRLGSNRTTLVFDASALRRASSRRFDALVYRWNVSESAEIGSILGRVGLVGWTNGGTRPPHFRIANEFGGCGDGGGQETANCFFRVDAETGDLLLQRPLDSSIPRHVVVVEAAEEPTTVAVARTNYNTPRTVVVVDVLDENDHAPEFLSRSNYTLTVADSQRLGVSIHHFVAVDRDIGPHASLTYEIVAGNERKMFDVDIHNGALTVRNWTTLLSRRFLHNLRVRATDCASNCASSAERRHVEQSFTVFADESLAVGRSSKSLENYFLRGQTLEFTMTADAPPNTVVHNFKRNDGPADVTFRVFPRADSAFAVGERDGVLKTTRMLNESLYSATVLALWRDANGKTRAERVVVTVRVGAATVRRPQIAPATCGDVIVPENVAVPNLARIFAHLEGGTDDENNDKGGLHFRIEGGSGSRKRFAIDERTGVVSCVELDREEKEEHLLVISVADESTPPKVDVCTLRVRVLDDNDNAPRFDDTMSPDTVDIDDTIMLGSMVARLRAHDADASDNGRLHYRLTADRSRMLDVDVETGDLIFAREFAFAGTDWIITVTAEDCGATRILSAEKQLRIVWRRRPLAPTTLAELALRGRAPPRFLRRRYIGAVPENRPAGHAIARLDTDWPRGPPYLSYRIISGDSNGAFTVDERGDLRTTRALDAERRASYRLRVVAEQLAGGGGGGAGGGWTPPPETTVDIHVLSVNDNPPVLAPLKPLLLDEDLAVGSLVATATAIDSDSDSTLEFTLNPVSRHFAIGRYTGSMVLTRALDRELADRHMIGVQVYDGEHVTRANLTVRVRDVNDNVPRFDAAVGGGGGTLAELEVVDGGWPGAILKRFSATDRDAGANGALRYALVGEAANATRRLFAVNDSTGDLTLLRRLADGDERLLEIRASDGGTPQRSSVLSVRVLSVGRARNADDAGPMFNSSVIRLSLSENHPPFLPFANASEWLRAGGRPPTDWRVESPAESPFAIHPSTGEIYATVALNRENTVEWRFRIGTGAKSVDVFVDVIDANDNGPEFGTWNDVTKISANMSSGTVVARLNAVDADVLNNGRLTYELLASGLPIGQNVLRLNETSGVLSFDRWDDGLVEELLVEPSTGVGDLRDPRNLSLTLVIGAHDGGTPSRVTVADVTVPLDLSGWPGGAPRFTAGPFRKFVLETTQAGDRLFNAAAVSRLPASYRRSWTYAIESVGGSPSQLLTINATTADVTLAGRLDYETLAVHSANSPSNTARLEYKVSVTDASGRLAAVPLELYVVGVDEFAPVFSKLSYTFQVPFDTEAGAWLGAVDATDRDAGADGRVRFEWRSDGVGGRKSSLAKYFRLNATSGVIHLRRPIPAARLHQSRTVRDEDDGVADIVRLTIVASSGSLTHPLSSKAVVYFEIGKEPSDPSSVGDRLRRAVAALGTSTAALLAVFGALLLCLITVTIARVCCCRAGGRAKVPARRHGADEAMATKRRQVYSVANNARLPLAADDSMGGGGGLSPSPTLAKLRLPPPPSRSLSGDAYASRADPSDVCALLAAATASGGGGPLSQPDSGIDPDGASLNSAVAAVFQFDATAGRTAQILSTHNFRPYQPMRDGPLLYGDLGLR